MLFFNSCLSSQEELLPLTEFHIQQNSLPHEAFEETPPLQATPGAGPFEFYSHDNGWMSCGTEDQSCFFNPCRFVATTLFCLTATAACTTIGWLIASISGQCCTNPTCCCLGGDLACGDCANFGSLVIDAPGNSTAANASMLVICGVTGAGSAFFPACNYCENKTQKQQFDPYDDHCCVDNSSCCDCSPLPFDRGPRVKKGPGNTCC